MSAHFLQPAYGRTFHTSTAAIASAALLFGSVQSIVSVLEELVRPAVFWLVNRSIEQGHFQFDRLSHGSTVWRLVVLQSLAGAVALCLSFGLATWNYQKRSKSSDQRAA